MKENRSGGMVAVIHASTIVKSFLAILAILLFLFSVSGILTSLRPEYRISSQSVHTVTNQFSGKMLFSLLANENHYFFSALPEGKPESGITDQVLKLSSNISLDDPRSLLGRELPGFSIFDSEIILAGEGTNYTNMPIESPPPDEVLFAEREAAIQNLEDLDEPSTEPNQAPALTTNGKKVVQIYHTHNRESFLPYLKGVTNPDHAHHSEVNITRLGKKLAEDLEGNGIGASVDVTDVIGSLNQKGLTYPQSYSESRTLVEEAMATNRDLDYFIDIHRDSRRKKDTTITINERSYAKIAFVIGSENSNFEENIAIATKMHNLLQEKYPGLSRGILKQGGANSNGVYNQDLSGNSMLIEVGGVDNTFEEMYQTLDAFADVFSEIYWDAEEVNAPAASVDEK